MTLFWQFVIDGLMTGCMYAMIAFGFTIVWSSMRTVSLAQVDLLPFGAGIGYVCAGAGFVPAALAAASASALLGAVSYYVAIKKFLEVSLLSVMVATLGLGLIIENVMVKFTGTDPIGITGLLPVGGYLIGPFYLRKASAIAALIALGLLLFALFIAKRTKFGLAFRVTSWAPEIGAAHGVDIARTRLFSILMASAYSGLAGLLLALLSGSFSPFSGLLFALPALMAMLVGGAGNLYGAIVGGLMLGLTQSLAFSYISGALNNLVAFGLLVFVMVIRPQGILASR